jgi:hypothetical protein
MIVGKATMFAEVLEDGGPKRVRVTLVKRSPNRAISRCSDRL